jgi:hypothetical protein
MQVAPTNALIGMYINRAILLFYDGLFQNKPRFLLVLTVGFEPFLHAIHEKPKSMSIENEVFSTGVYFYKPVLSPKSLNNQKSERYFL